MGAAALVAPAAQGLTQEGLAVDMFRSVAAEQRKNVVFSPASAISLLRLLEQGAGGETLKAMQKLPLEAPHPTQMKPTEATALFAAEDLALRSALGSDAVYRVNFAKAPAEAVKKVNEWCSKNTQGLIPSILSPADVSADTRLVALDALYFKEKWETPFTKDNTYPDKWHDADGKESRRPMMHRELTIRYAAGEDWTAVALPYAGQERKEPTFKRGATKHPQGCFIGILPTGDAHEFAAGLTEEKWAAIRKGLAATRPEKVRVTLPRFEVKTPVFPLDTTMKAIGLSCLYGPGADFSRLSDEALALSKMMQRCYVKVNEEGTEAAAVTAGVMKRMALRPVEEPKRIRFDKPFIWSIGTLESDDAPLFMGITEDPESGEE